MPVHVDADVRRLDQREFGRIAYDVMEHVFAVHNEMGRFLDEEIYRNAVAGRVARSQTEVLVEVRFEDYRKQYYIDLLVDGGAVFELKAVRTLGAPQRAQLLNYPHNSRRFALDQRHSELRRVYDDREMTERLMTERDDVARLPEPSVVHSRFFEASCAFSRPSGSRV